MKYRCSVPLIILALVLVPVNCNNSTAETCYHCSMNNPKASTLGPELEGMSGYKRCCKGEVRDYFKSTHYKEIISNGTSVVVHENSSYEHYHSFISACAHYQPYGFGNTYINGNFFGDMEVAAFLAHVIGSKIYCEYLLLQSFCFVLCCRISGWILKDFFSVSLMSFNVYS